MKKREKIMGVREQLLDKSRRENLWYLSEEIVGNFSSLPKDENSKKPDRTKMAINRGSDPFGPKVNGKNKNKRECSFVVDWQLSESI